MKTPKLTPSVVPTSSAAVSSGFTLGLDLGDRQHHVCVLDAAGNIVREASLPNTRPALQQLLVDFPRSTVALEAGTHSPWISRFLTDLGAKVLVANPRKLHAISRSERKCDRRDAQMLARLRACVSAGGGVFVFKGMFEVNGLLNTPSCRPSRQLLQHAFFFR